MAKRITKTFTDTSGQVCVASLRRTGEATWTVRSTTKFITTQGRVEFVGGWEEAERAFNAL